MRDKQAERDLTEANRLALAHVAVRAQHEQPGHLKRIETALASAGVTTTAEALLAVASIGGALTLNFHPDRLLADGRCVAQALHDDGVYRSQFETRISIRNLTITDHLGIRMRILFETWRGGRSHTICIAWRQRIGSINTVLKRLYSLVNR